MIIRSFALVAVLILFVSPAVAQDSAEVERYRQAAEQGDAEAQYKLAQMYVAGNGVRRNHRRAVRWYRQAAEQGYDEAQFSLGSMYEFGLGVREDYAEAARWYRMAAEQGDPRAQVSLALMYDSGEGVPQDIIEVYIWLSLALENGVGKADSVAPIRDRIGSVLSSDELVVAQQEIARRLETMRSR